MDSFALLIGGLGIGSLITSFATHLMSRRAAIRDRLYAEKREAYLGLLGALHQAVVKPSDENVAGAFRRLDTAPPRADRALG